MSIGEGTIQQQSCSLWEAAQHVAPVAARERHRVARQSQSAQLGQPCAADCPPRANPALLAAADRPCTGRSAHPSSAMSLYEVACVHRTHARQLAALATPLQVQFNLDMEPDVVHLS